MQRFSWLQVWSESSIGLPVQFGTGVLVMGASGAVHAGFAYWDNPDEHGPSKSTQMDHACLQPNVGYIDQNQEQLCSIFPT